MPKISSKIVSLSQLLKWRKEQKQKKKTVVFTNGCFDVLHRGHVMLLEKCSQKGDSVIVGLNSDDSVKRLKGPTRPINTQADRAFVLAGLESVSRVVIFKEDTPYEILSKIKPDILVKGADYKVKEIAGHEFAGKTVRIKLLKGRSSSVAINKMQNC